MPRTKDTVDQVHTKMLVMSYGKAVTKTATAFQKLVRVGNADVHGFCICCTCDKRMKWNHRGCHAGHYITRSKLPTLLDDRNVHPQCSSCNRWESGNKEVYAAFLVDKYGPSICRDLVALSLTDWRPSKYELAELFVQFRDETDSLIRNMK